jgi:hypothetical protein
VTITSDSPNPTVTAFVLLDAGNESRFVSTNPGVSILGLGKRQERLTRRGAE